MLAGGGVVYCELSQHAARPSNSGCHNGGHSVVTPLSAPHQCEVLLTHRVQAGGRPGSGLPGMVL